MFNKKVKSIETDVRLLKNTFYTCFLPIYNRFAKEFEDLRNELANNGVVRDLRKAEKAIATLSEQNLELLRKYEELKTNGVATAINKLNAEVFKTKKEKKNPSSLHDIFRIRFLLAGEEDEIKPEEEATLAGKVDAIIAHLGLDVTVKPEEVTKAKVVAKKVAAPKKKSRR